MRRSQVGLAAEATSERDLESIKPLFRYARIIAERRIVDRDDAAEFMSFRERIFVSFGYIGDDERFAPPLGMGRLQSGWKIHIAVSQDNVEAAWDIVKDILIDERIAEVKVVRPGVVFDEFERGKQITIYQFCNPDRNWEMILQRIENALREAYRAGIIHIGRFCTSDRQIP